MGVFALLALVLMRRVPQVAAGCACVALAACSGGLSGTGALPSYGAAAGFAWILVAVPWPAPVRVAVVAAAILGCAILDVTRAPRLQGGEAIWAAAAPTRPLAAVHLAKRLAASPRVLSRRAAADHLERAAGQLPANPLKLEALHLHSIVSGKLGAPATASQSAEAATALAEALHAKRPPEVDDARLLEIYLHTVECFNIVDSRKKVDHYFARAKDLAPGHPEVLAGDAERLYVALVHAVRRSTGDANVDVTPGWLPTDDSRVPPIQTKLDVVLAKDGGCYRALVLRGRIAEAQGGVLSAVPLYNAAIAAKPSRVEARVLLATLYVANDLPKAAEECVLTALKDGLDDPALHYLLGNIYAVQGRRDDARRYLEAYLLNRPDNRNAKVLLANLLSAEALSKSDRIGVGELSRYAKRIKELNPDDPKGLMVQAAVFAKSQPRKYIEAIVLLEKALGKMPANRDVLRQLAAAHRDYGWAMVLSGRREPAMDHFIEFLKLAPAGVRTEAVENALTAHVKSLEQAGRTSMAKRDSKKASAIFRRATQLQPKRAQSFYQLGVACLHQEDLIDARAAFETAIDLCAVSGQNHCHYALPLLDLYVRTGEDDAAKKLAARVLASPGDADPDTLAKIRKMVK